jgi:hypothetical protein
MSLLLTPLKPTALATLLGVEESASPEHETILQEIGRVMLQSCLLRFVSQYSEPEQAELEEWLAAHMSDPTLTEEMLQKFPKFAAMLSDELESLASTGAQVRAALASATQPAFAQ